MTSDEMTSREFYGAIPLFQNEKQYLFITTLSVVFMVRISQKSRNTFVPCSVLFSSRYIDEKKIFRQRSVSSSG